MSRSLQVAKLGRELISANQGQNLGVGTAGDPAGSFSALSNRNKIINGDIRIAQRGTTYALTTSYAYGSVDRWAFVMATSAAGVANQVASGLTGFQYALKLGRNSGSALTNYIGAIQALETINSIPLQGKTVTFSFYAKAGANFSASGSTIIAKLGSGTGTDQSTATFGTWTGATDVVSTTPSITTSWVRYQFTGTVPSGCTQLGIQFAYTPTGTAGADDNVYITGVQLEEGNVATPFEHIDYGEQLRKCQRYYEKGDYSMFSGNVTSGATYYTISYYKINKRVAPSITTTISVQSSFPATNPTAGSITIDTFVGSLAANASAAAGYFTYSWVASAEL